MNGIDSYLDWAVLRSVVLDSEFDQVMALSRAERDFQLSPSLLAKDAVAVLENTVCETQAAQCDPNITALTDISYGPRPRQKLDVYHPAGNSNSPAPAIVFLHGGFWQEGDKAGSGFAAASFVAQGWASVAVGYSLTPEVSLTALTSEIDDALQHIADHAGAWGIDPDRLVLVGHSAGAHLAATVMCDLLGSGAQNLISGAILISGVFELAPIAQSYVNALAHITEDEVHLLSPLRHAPLAKIPVHILIGADEPDAFQIQSMVLRDRWQKLLPELTFHSAQNRDHFDVLEELCDPLSATRQAISRMIVNDAKN